jgi:hypothetical protein
MLAGVSGGPGKRLALPGDEVEVGGTRALNDHQLAGALERVLQFVDALTADVHVVVQGGIRGPCTATNCVKMGHLLRYDILTNRIPLYIGAVSINKLIG